MQTDQTVVRLLAIPDAARYLGTTIWAVRQLIWKNKLHPIKIGKRFLMDRADLDAFVEKMKQEAA